jgi:hypothetical protein
VPELGVIGTGKYVWRQRGRLRTPGSSLVSSWCSRSTGAPSAPCGSTRNCALQATRWVSAAPTLAGSGAEGEDPQVLKDLLEGHQGCH